MPRWIWRALLIVAGLQCAAVLLAALARIVGLVSEPATLLDGIVAAMAVCVALIALLLYRHHTALNTEVSQHDRNGDAVMAAQLTLDLAPLTPMTWHPIPHVSHDALTTHDLPPAPSTPLPLLPEELKSA